MNATIQFIDGHFSVIRIPLALYSALLQPILKLLIPHDGTAAPSSEDFAVQALDDMCLEDKHGFLNISITPLECSIVCHEAWAKKIFQPVISALSKDVQNEVSISKNTYMVFSVQTAGMEAGQRVMDLTAPLAMAGIPIFFITTYYTDFILVPSKDHPQVKKALEARGFVLSESDSSYIQPPPSMAHSRSASSLSLPPSTPPPANVAELQKRTFHQLQKRSVTPKVVPGLHLVQCSGKELDSSDDYLSRPQSNGTGSNGANRTPHWLDGIDAKLYLGLVAALISQPRFLSLTFSTDDAPSLLIDKTLLSIFGDSVAGDTESCLVPIFLDLSNLPLESTGIVCGVAGKLVDEMRMIGGDEMGGGDAWQASELSYLSTARAGAVILSSEGSAQALEVLMPLLEKGEGK